MARCAVRVTVLAGLVLGLGGSSVLAQGPDTAAVVPAGARIRVRLVTGPVETGRLLQPLTPATAALVYCAAPALACGGSDARGLRRRPWAEIAELERRTGERTVHGALVGAAIGAGVLLLGTVALHDQDAPVRQGPSRVVALASFAGVSVLIGALIGSAQGEWEHVR